MVGDFLWNNPPCFSFLVSNKRKSLFDLTCPSSNKIACPLPWTFFCLTVAVIIPSSAELSVFIGFGSWVKTSSWSLIHRDNTICPLWNSPPTSASVTDATTWLMILYSMWIGPFAGGGRFRYFSGWLVVSWGNSALQCGCKPLDLISMMHHCQCEVSYC